MSSQRWQQQPLVFALVLKPSSGLATCAGLASTLCCLFVYFAGLSGDYSTASAVSLSADRVAPILTVGYLVTKSDWSTEGPEEGQRGELVRALCAFFQSATVAGGSTGTSSALGLFADAGLLAMGPTLTAALK